MPERTALGVLVLLVALLAGCGEQDTASPEPTAEPSATSAAPSARPTVEQVGPGSGSAAANRPVPVNVKLPSLGLDEDLIDLGLEPSGELQVPEDPRRVGWYTGGGRPGGFGPTVIVGHLDSRTGPAVFSRLTDLAPGDEVSVTNADGDEVVYRVTRTDDFVQSDFPTEAVFGATPDDQLRLITCTGPYDSSIGRYEENRVVFATAV